MNTRSVYSQSQWMPTKLRKENNCKYVLDKNIFSTMFLLQVHNNLIIIN